MNKTIELIIISSIIGLSIIGGVNLTDDNVYFCESKNLVRSCDKLSSGIGTRCYFNETYKICKEGWQEVVGEVEIQKRYTPSSSDWLCSHLSCEQIRGDKK